MTEVKTIVGVPYIKVSKGAEDINASFKTIVRYKHEGNKISFATKEFVDSLNVNDQYLLTIRFNKFTISDGELGMIEEEKQEEKYFHCTFDGMYVAEADLEIVAKNEYTFTVHDEADLYCGN